MVKISSIFQLILPVYFVIFYFTKTLCPWIPLGAFVPQPRPPAMSPNHGDRWTPMEMSGQYTWTSPVGGGFRSCKGNGVARREHRVQDVHGNAAKAENLRKLHSVHWK